MRQINNNNNKHKVYDPAILLGTDIPQRYCGFVSRPLQESKHHNKATQIIFWFPGTYELLTLCCSLLSVQ